MSNIGVNKVILIGNAGQDVDVKSTSSGKAVTNFSLAINQPFRDKKGENTPRVEWVRCVAWNKQAEIAGKFVTKGQQVFVEGRLQTRQYEDRQGTTKTVTEVVVTSLRVLGGAKVVVRGHNGRGATTSVTSDVDSEAIPF